jgi:hypothetical protein
VLPCSGRKTERSGPCAWQGTTLVPVCGRSGLADLAGAESADAHAGPPSTMPLHCPSHTVMPRSEKVIRVRYHLWHQRATQGQLVWTMPWLCERPTRVLCSAGTVPDIGHRMGPSRPQLSRRQGGRPMSCRTGCSDADTRIARRWSAPESAEMRAPRARPACPHTYALTCMPSRFAAIANSTG